MATIDTFFNKINESLAKLNPDDKLYGNYKLTKKGTLESVFPLTKVFPYIPKNAMSYVFESQDSNIKYILHFSKNDANKYIINVLKPERTDKESLIQYVISDKKGKKKNYTSEGNKVKITENGDINAKHKFVGENFESWKEEMLKAKFDKNFDIINIENIDEIKIDEVIPNLLKWIECRDFVKQKAEDDPDRKKNEKENKQKKAKSNTKESTMKPSLNTILYGPPGTGKTYNTINKALEIIAINEAEQDKIDSANDSKKREEQNKIFNDYKKLGQIEFVTFHQNYTYEDFVIGLKPNIDNGEHLTFKQNFGLFYNIAEKARINYIKSKEDNIKDNKLLTFENKLSMLFKSVFDEDTPVKIKMKSGKELEVYDISETTIYFRKPSGSNQHTLSIKTLREYLTNPNRLVNNGLQPYYNAIINSLNSIKIDKVEKQTLNNYVLIIDEINRANISRVFGELITLLEDDKRIDTENELIVTLPNGEAFGVPKNLYIIGTMNTADKSIALIDIALRRRFEFEGKYPNATLIEDKHMAKNEDYKTAQDLLNKINENIIKAGKSADFTIGHAFFMKNMKIADVIEKKIIPLLLEYFNNDPKKVKEIFKDSGYEAIYNTDEKKPFTWKCNPKENNKEETPGENDDSKTAETANK